MVIRRGTRSLEVPYRFWRCANGCLSDADGPDDAPPLAEHDEPRALEWIDRKTNEEDRAQWDARWRLIYGESVPKPLPRSKKALTA